MIAYPSTDWSQLRNREIPGINVKLKPEEYGLLAQDAPAAAPLDTGSIANVLAEKFRTYKSELEKLERGV